MHKTQSLYGAALIRTAIWESIKRLSPMDQIKNPVMFVVWLGSLLTTGLFVQALGGQGEARGVETPGFILAISLWL